MVTSNLNCFSALVSFSLLAAITAGLAPADDVYMWLDKVYIIVCWLMRSWLLQVNRSIQGEHYVTLEYGKLGFVRAEHKRERRVGIVDWLPSVSAPT